MWRQPREKPLLMNYEEKAFIKTIVSIRFYSKKYRKTSIDIQNIRYLLNLFCLKKNVLNYFNFVNCVSK